MSGLQNLINKVISDSKESSDKILKENEIECDKIKQEIEKETQKEYEEIINKAHQDASLLHERIISKEELNLRNKTLILKQESIENCMEKLRDRLMNLKEEEYLKYLKNGLLTVDASEDVEVKVANKFKKSAEKLLIKMGDKYKISNDTLKNNDGFILIKDKLIMDFTYESVIDFYKDDLEKMIIEELFT